MKEKFILLISGIVVCLSILFYFNTKTKNNLLKDNAINKGNFIAIMVKENGTTKYTKYNSDSVPKGDYELNEEKSYCENNGSVLKYDNEIGTISFNFIGSSRCYLYFDYSDPITKLQAVSTILNNNGGSYNIKNNKSSTMKTLADDLGTSYYFYDWTANNYVKFGKYSQNAYLHSKYNDFSETYIDDSCTNCSYTKKLGTSGSNMLWQIIRINGDGSIRLVYAGTDNDNDNKSIGKTTFNKTGYCELYSNDCMSYMPSSTDSQVTYNATNSYIKEYIDKWYELYLNISPYKSYVVDAIYCNDRLASSGKKSKPVIDSSMTTHKFYDRLQDNIYTLECGNIYNSLTVNEYINNYQGSGTLTYPIALMTGDEVRLTNMSNPILTMTPFFLSNGGATDMAFYISIYASTDVYPVISLSKDVTLLGTGTKSDPYYIKELNN